MNDTLQQLRDIKPPVEVPDDSLVLFLSLTLLLIFVAGAIWLLLSGRKRIKRRRRPDPKEIARKKLGSIDFKNTKDAVYTFGEYLPLLIEDEDMMERFEKVRKDLERYKYRKDVPPLDEYDIKNMRKLIKKALRDG